MSKEKDVQIDMDKARGVWRSTRFVVLGFSILGCWLFGWMNLVAVIILTLGHVIVNGALIINLRRIKSKLKIKSTVPPPGNPDPNDDPDN